ncbi:hypothetical protein [Kitasatospora sp. NPDC088779]|uniref:hypothetical protein n=1 Tax=Kitasatospora sp. NPDC088779 TaxID=3154964 RepID=UPI00341B9875
MVAAEQFAGAGGSIAGEAGVDGGLIVVARFDRFSGQVGPYRRLGECRPDVP